MPRIAKCTIDILVNFAKLQKKQLMFVSNHPTPC